MTLLLFLVVPYTVFCEWAVGISTRWVSISLDFQDDGKALDGELVISRDANPVTLVYVIINEPFVPFLSRRSRPQVSTQNTTVRSKLVGFGNNLHVQLWMHSGPFGYK